MTAKARLTWKDVRDQIHAKVLDGSYAPGEKLPRDEDLAQQLGCARSTVLRAMQDLSYSGIVERRRKGGTSVRTDRLTRATFDIPITRKEVEQKGGTYGYQLIERAIQAPPRSIAARMAAAPKQQMLRVQALHLADQRPFIYEDRWVCLDTVPEILEVDLERVNANEWLVQNKPYNECDLRFYAVNASEYDAKQLEILPGEALFVIERTTWIEKQPITCVKQITRPGYQMLTRV